MTRYYFHVWNGEEYEHDDTGIECESSDEAYFQAFQGAGEISLDMLRRGRGATRYRFDVVDSEGRLIHAVPFTEAMGRTVANQPVSGFIRSASRGYDLASDLVRQIAIAQEILATSRKLLACPFGIPSVAGRNS